MTTTTQPAIAEFGRARKRKEDARLITGRTRWTDNITLPGMLHLAVVRSPLAHAKITKINADAARRMPGVHGVFTAADLDAEGISLPCAWPITADMKSPQSPPLAVDTVHFAGEGVAIVVARDAASARDAADAVEVDYDPMEPLLDMEAAPPWSTPNWAPTAMLYGSSTRLPPAVEATSPTPSVTLRSW